MDDRGSISLVTVGILAVIGLVAVLLGELGAQAVRSARTAAIADVVAMAAAGDSSAAEQIAAANGATLVASFTDGIQTEVVIRRYETDATARAELLPHGWWYCKSRPSSDPVNSQSCP